jgi:hypothetical protein
MMIIFLPFFLKGFLNERYESKIRRRAKTQAATSTKDLVMEPKKIKILKC